MSAAELSFVEAFVLPDKQGRWSELLGSKKGRQKLTSRLAHNPDLDPRFMKPPAHLESPAELSRLLRSKGSPDLVHVVSEQSSLDGRDMPLVEAVDSIFASGMGAVLICVPDRLAYYEAEHHDNSRLLERGAG